MPTVNVQRASITIRAMCFFALLAGIQGATAQTALDFRRIITDWPAIHLDFRVTCAGTPQYAFTPENFDILENGIPVTPSVGTTQPSPACASSVALVFDCGHSMSYDILGPAAQAGRRFVSRMDGTYDQAAIVRFESRVSVVRPMTSDTAQLAAAIGGLVTGQSSALWDGIYAGLVEIVNNASNTCTALVVITDGPDDASARSAAQVISYAALHHIRLYPIGVMNAPMSDLRLLAAGTGGIAYNPTMTGLDDTFDAIYNDIFPCKVTFESSCMNGTAREVTLRVKDVCAGPLMDKKSHVAPDDPSAYTRIAVTLGSATVRNGGTAALPLSIDGLGYGEILHPSRFTLNIDNTACTVRFGGIRAATGSALHDSSFAWVDMGNSIDIRILDSSVVYTRATLAELLFTTDAVRDTCVSTLSIANWTFSRGCYRPEVSPCTLRVAPSDAVITGAVMAPDSAHWDPQQRAYLPQPLHVSMLAMNKGFRDATNARFSISFDSTDFEPMNPAAVVQPGRPVVVAGNGGVSLASWDLHARNRAAGGTARVCITASFDNNPDVSACATIHIDPTGAIPECTLSAPDVTLDNIGRNYLPMPIRVTCDVTNTGGADADSVRATIVIPEDLFLAGGDAPANTVKSVATRIPVGGHASVSWELGHVISAVADTDMVRVIVTSAGASNSTCERGIVMPAIAAPVFKLECDVPDSLEYDEKLGAYVPHPFEVEVYCRNLGARSALNATARIELPRNVVLADPLDSLSKALGPAWLSSSDPAPVPVSWMVRYTAFPHEEDYLVFRFIVSWMDSVGRRMDSTATLCRVAMPPRNPLFVTGSTALCPPDSVVLDAGAGYRSYHWNNGDTVRRIVVRSPGRYACTMIDPNGGRVFSRTVDVTLRAMFPGVSVNGNTRLCAGDSATLTADSGYAAYVWNTGVHARTIIVRTGGWYTCMVKDARGCTGSTVPVEIVAQPALNPAIVAIGHLPLCRGDSVTLDAGAGYRRYRWSTRDTTRTRVVRSAGTFICDVEDSAACTGSTPPFVVGTQNPPTPMITVTNAGPHCKGDSVELDAGAGYARYRWSTGETTRRIRVGAGGAYRVIVETLDGCPGPSPDVVIAFLPGPPMPTIARNGNVLSTQDSAARYAWLRNDVVLAGETQSSLVVTQPGLYVVKVFSEGGCATASPGYLVDTLLAIEQAPTATGFDIWPDPSDGVCYVSITLDQPGEVSISVMDIFGKTCHAQSHRARPGSNTFTIDISDQPAGTYFLHTRLAGKTTMRRIVRR